jgi:hypothetical protein
MAVNDSRSMNADFHQGVIDRSYIQLTPDRGVVENPPVDRLLWPTYQHAEMFDDNSHIEAAFVQATRPVEFLKRPNSQGSEPRY